MQPVLLLVGPLVLGALLPPASPLLTSMCSTLPKDSDKCGESKRRFFYNETSKACEPFTYTGCPWNRNHFYTREECRRTCGHIEKPGFCLPDASVVSAECSISCLHDGDCLGDQKCCSVGCALRCVDPVKDTCRLPLKAGPCDKKEKRWFYDTGAKRCRRFWYGGCYGNENNFQTLKECRQRCVLPGPSARPQ